jgi:hypothetical protein
MGGMQVLGSHVMQSIVRKETASKYIKIICKRIKADKTTYTQFA